MVNHISTKLEILVSDTDYTPVWESTSKTLKTEATKRDGPGRWQSMPIFKFLVMTNDNSGNISLWALDNSSAVVIPKSSLKVGQEYSFYLKKFSATGITLLGYRTKNYPIEL